MITAPGPGFALAVLPGTDNLAWRHLLNGGSVA